MYACAHIDMLFARNAPARHASGGRVRRRAVAQAAARRSGGQKALSDREHFKRRSAPHVFQRVCLCVCSCVNVCVCRVYRILSAEHAAVVAVAAAVLGLCTDAVL